MASQDLQPCLVCGVETKNRCSSCQAAGVDIFLCSRDHLKLIWKAHKPHCGPGKANPFRLPPLSEEEMIELHGRKDEVIWGPTGLTTILRSLASICGRSEEHVLEHIAGPPDDMSLPYKPHLINLVRSTRFILSSDHGDDNASFDVVFTAFTGVVLDCLAKARLLPRDQCASPWWTPLHHRLVVAASLASQMTLAKNGVRTASTQDEAARWEPVAGEQAARWLHDGLGVGDERLGAALAGLRFDLSEFGTHADL
ncbi:hypothetical protein JCM9279_004112 [Rhodotorula babjevae]